MQKRGYWWVLLLAAVLAIAGCSDDDNIATPAADVFPTVAASVEAVMNDSAVTVGGISADALATELAADPDAYTIIDIRSLSVYNAGHIPGAYHSSLGSLLTDVGTTIPTDKTFVVACYTGQSAGHAVVALKLMGYDAKTLLFGMSNWDTGLSASWDDNIDNLLTIAETTNNNGSLVAHAYPVLTGYSASTSVAERVQEMLDNGFQGITYSQMVTDGLDEYFIVNYFGEADYMGTGTAGVPGHIPGSYQFTPYASLDRDSMLDNLPTDKTIVVYCWTGQHSSQITAYLNVMGYDAKSLKFGSNALFHDDLTAHVWNGTTNTYPLEVTTGSTTPQFQAIVDAAELLYNDSAVTVGAISADALATELAMDPDAYTIIDIRSASVYAAGHIPGAYSSSLGTLLTDVGTTIPTDKTFVVACYTGQGAGHAVVALRMMGYDAKTLLFGMSNWDTGLSGSWDDNIDNLLTIAETTNNNGDLTTNEFPTLEGYSASSVVSERVQEMLDNGFQGITYSQMVTDGLDEYFIVNYFGEADYLGTGTAGAPGHIPGSYQFTPYASLGDEEMLNNLPTDKTIVVYCWTGQHSSQITAYLNMLGYTAKSLKFGSNALFHDDLTAHAWNGTTNTYPLEQSASPQFEAVAEACEALYNDSAVTVGAISADALALDLAGDDTYTIIDIRSASAYTAGHIPGAYNSTLAGLLDTVGTAIPTDKPFVVACYTGQSAGHAVVALRLAGYQAKTLLFGMSNWDTDLSASWDDNIDNLLTIAETTNNNGDLTTNAFPALDTYDVATVVDDRVDEMLADGFQGITYQQMVLDGLENYFIVNYFGEADYLGTGTAGAPGHIPGSYQFTPYASLGFDEMLSNLPTDKTIVVYCWTGQHSSQITAYLNIMGYDAKSLKFGSNALFHDLLTAHVWNGTTNEYPLEPTPPLKMASGF